MRIAILSGSDGWHVRDLQRAAESLGHSATAVDFRQLSAHTPQQKGCPELANYDAVIVRTMPPGSLEQVVFRMDLLQRLEADGIPVINPAKSLEVCVDKYLALERLRQHGLPVPETIVCQTADSAMLAFETLGRDVVVKPIFGSEGRGLMRISDAELAWRTFRTLERTAAVLYLQRFIAHPGWDLRAFVLDGRVIAAMKRSSNSDWRTNVAQGAKAESVVLTAEQTQLALQAAEAVGTIVAGVDLLPGPNSQWYVVEVNAVPGWKTLAPVSGIDVAVQILRSITPGKKRAVTSQRSDFFVPLACTWEVLAPKVGNVHPQAKFRDMSHVDFLMSGTAITPVMQNAVGRPLGETILEAIQATRRVVKTNTNLGIVLLLAPLASVPEGEDLQTGVEKVLNSTTIQDSVHVYEAIRLAIPGGLGEKDDQDVHKTPTKAFREIMISAASYDQIAAEYANGFLNIFQLGPPILAEGLKKFGRLELAIVYLQLRWLAMFEDTLITRKRGPVIARETVQRAKNVLANGGPNSPLLAEFDAWLRADGNARNPGTTADLVTACLYVALRQRTLTVDTAW